MPSKLVLFDIDGTLLHTHGAGRRAIHSAILREFGAQPPARGVRFDGKTDPQIVRELLAASDYAAAEDAECIAAVCRRYVALLGDELAAAVAMTVYPGVIALLDTLEKRADTTLGLLTGNLAEGARLKLSAAGIAPERFRVGAFGSDDPDRANLPAIAAARATPIMGRRPVGEEIVIVGDTPADITCGRDVGARAIGVATGSYSMAALAAAGAYTVFADLSPVDAVLDAIYA